MRVAIGADHRGFEARVQVIELLQRMDCEVIDLGVFTTRPVDYPDIAAAVARQVSAGEAERGILIGGTGLEMCIVANKYPGVRAAPVHDALLAELSRRYMDVNVLCLSAELLGEQMLGQVIGVWLSSPFEGGRHARRLEEILQVEQEVYHDFPHRAAATVPIP